MPSAKVFDSMYHNFRLFGSILLVFVGLIILAGVKVNYFLCNLYLRIFFRLSTNLPYQVLSL